MALRPSALCVCFLLVAAAAAAQNNNLTGTWSGNVAGTTTCQNGTQHQSTGTATVAMIQSGGGVTGFVRLSLQNTCDDSGSEVDTFGFSGQASGTGVTGQASPKGERLTYSISTSGSSMSFSISGVGVVLSGSLSRTSSEPPAGDLTGTYVGTYSSVLSPCGGRLPLVMTSGAAALTIIQVGTYMSGAIDLAGVKSDRFENEICTVFDSGPESFEGEVDGSRLTFRLGRRRQSTFTTNISGNTIAATVHGEFPGEVTSFSVTRTSSTPPAAKITTFTATPSTIVAGASATLSWSTANATTVTIDHSIGSQPWSGSVTVAPSTTTTYTLNATGFGGAATATTLITVGGGNPQIVVAAMPTGIVATSGEAGAPDTFSVANIGNAAANVLLTTSGSFFSIQPSSFILAPQSSQLVTITPSAENAGAYDGSVTVSGDGVVTGGISVPVRLLVAGAPAGSVRPQPSTARVDVSAPSGQSPSGFVSFTNTGTAAMNAIAVGSVPWIVPERGVITISPGETKNVNFTIDRRRRADADALIGGVTGTLSLRFLGSATAANAIVSATAPVSTVSVTVVDVVQPAVTAGAPPPLGNGELALFVASHISNETIAGDLFFSNRSSSALTNIRLFQAQSNQFASFPSIASNAGVVLPSVSRTVFANSAAGFMLRGNVESLAAGALRMTNAAGSTAAYTSWIPVFRSDRGVGPGGRIVLSGVDQSTAAPTVVVLQELNGAATTVALQGYDAEGRQVGSEVPVAMSAFYSVTDDGMTVTADTRSVHVINRGTGPARINAYARVRGNTTPDSFIIVDPTIGSTSESLIVPMISTPGIASQTDLYITNTKNAAITATMDVIGTSKRRAVRSHAVGDTETTASQQVSIPSLGTRRVTLPASGGYVRLTGTPGSISAAGRITMTSGTRSFGSALPVLTATAALSAGQTKRFNGVGDSSAGTIAGGTPATFRSSLLLIETTGQTAIVRVSLWYSSPAGSLVTVQSVSSREFGVAGNAMLVINDLARSVIGAQRDAFGDLRDMQVDVEVVGGTGRVLPYIESIDNGSSDVVIRPE